MLSMTSEKLQFLGRGAAFFPSEGNTSAFIKNEETLYLFDCGETVFQKIIEKKILDNVTDVHIFITHIHSDHIGSLSSLLYYLKYIKNIIAHVYCYDINLLQVLGKQGNDGFEWHCLKIYNSYEYIIIDDNFSISYCRTCHSNMPSTGFTIYYKGTVRYYSGDTAMTSFDWIKHLLINEDADAIYIDTSLNGVNEVHVGIDTIAKNIPIDFRNKIWCMHIDSLDVITRAKEYGFNVVEVI